MIDRTQRRVALAAALVLVGAGRARMQTPVAQSSELRIVVITGEDAVNIIQQRTAVAPIVEVRDRNNTPVAGALVTFSIQGGQNATFGGGLRSVTMVTNAAGRAATASLTPTASGAVRINVAATFQGQTAAVTITQTNVMTAAQAASGSAVSGAAGGSAAGGGGLSAITIGAIAGGAAGGTLVALNVAGGSGESSSSGSAAPGSSSGPSAGGSSGGSPPSPAPPTSPTRTTYSGPFAGQLLVSTTVTSVSGTTTCVSTRSIAGTLTLALAPQVDGTLTGSASTTGTQSELGVTGPPSCVGSFSTVPFNVGGTASGPPANITFSNQTVSTSTEPAMVTVTNTTTFAGALDNGVVSGSITHTQSSTGQQPPPGNATITGSGPPRCRSHCAESFREHGAVMNRRMATGGVLVLLAAHGLVLAQDGPVLTLAQAVTEARAKNERLLMQQDAVTQSDLGLRLARNEFRPKVTPNVLGSFGQTNVNSQTYRVDVSQRFVTGTELRLGTGTSTAQIPGPSGIPGDDILFYNADTTLTLSQPLLRGFGRDVARRSLTSAEVRRHEADTARALAEQQVAIDVASAYYRLVSQQTFVTVARQSLDRSRKLRDASEAKLDAGLVSQLDVLRAQQLVSQAELQLFDAQSAVDDARDQLTFLLGRTTHDFFDVDTTIPRPELVPIDVNAATALALGSRLDLKSRATDRVEADRRVHFARNQLLPQVDVNLALTRRETSDSFARSFGLDGYRFATFFTIAMPVDRTAQQVEHQSAVIDRDRRVREITTLERQISDDVRRAVRDRDRLLRSMLAAETSVQLSRNEVEVAQLRYERGLSNNLDVVSAESSLLAAESRRIQILADSAVARLRLRAVVGVLNPRTDIESGVDLTLPGQNASAVPDAETTRERRDR